MSKKIGSAEWMNIFFFSVLAFGLAFLSANFTLASEEQVLVIKETFIKSFVIRFLIYYLLGLVFVLLITTVNRILIKTGVIPEFDFKRLMKIGFVIMFVFIAIGTYLFLS